MTATLYYSDAVDGSYSVWTDPAQSPQANPQTTSGGGRYSWMVPTGWWKVRYEKDGYQIAETDPMRVPPIHTTVNIGLLSTTAPQAAVKPAAGEITVLFTKYMQLESLIRLFGAGIDYTADSFDASAFAIRFYDGEGKAIPGRVTFPDRRVNTGYTGQGYGRDVIGSAWFVRQAVFTPDDSAVELSRATWSFASGAVSYAGVALNTTAQTPLYMVTLNPNGGSLGTTAYATDIAGKLNRLPEPAREGYIFQGWYTAPAGGSRVTADTAFTQDAVLYAQWVLNTVPTPEVVPAPGDQSSDSSDSSESEEPVSTTARSGDAIGG